MSNRLVNLRLNLDGHGIYADPRSTGPDLGRTKYVRFYRATPSGGGAISKNEDGRMCAVTGKDSLRIISVHDGSYNTAPGHKSSVGKGGYRIDASKNFWEGSGLKIDCASTDVAWGWGTYSNKIITSARNGELILWDINRTDASKFERKCRDHIRSINAMCVSHVVHHYCISGSSDGDLRVWDLRSFDRSILRVHHPAAVRSLAFSPSIAHPFYAIVGQDNGSIWRWDLSMGQRGCLDRLPVAHSGSVTSLDWCNRLPASYSYSYLHPPLAIPTSAHSHISLSGAGGPDAGGGLPDISPNNGLGWLASGGLDRCVKVWDLTSAIPQAANSSTGSGEAGGKMRNRPTYILHPSFPVRRVVWRPEYECELAVVSNAEFTPGSNPDLLGQGGGGMQSSSASHFASGGVRGGGPETGVVGSGATRLSSEVVGGRSSNLPGSSGFGPESRLGGAATVGAGPSAAVAAGDAVEIWDVRRGWIAKWSVTGSAAEGSVTDLVFGSESDVIWTQHSSGTFSQIDLRDCTKPIDSITRSTATWDASGSLTFVANTVTKHSRWEIPYDDIPADKRQNADWYNVKPKAIGDPRYTPRGEQDVGTIVVDDAEANLEVFERLAKGYVIWGDDETGPALEESKRDRVEVCKINAQVAFDAKQAQIGQTWLLLGASLSELATAAAEKKSSRKPVSRTNTPAHVPAASPPLPPSNYSFPPPSSTSQPILPSQLRKASPSGHSTSAPVIPPPPSRSTSGSVSRSRRLTPVSSTQSSPRQLPNGLPPLPYSLTPRRPSFYSSRPIDYGAGDIDLSRRSSISVYRRQSFSVHGSHSLSPAERGSNTGGGSGSLRHVGEGALDDSDSDEDEELVAGGGTVMDGDGGDESSDGLNGPGGVPVSSSLFQPVTSPALHNMRSMSNVPTPSPLSRVAGQQRWSSDEASHQDGNREVDDWAPRDDEDEETSPSPRSTDNEAEFEPDSDENEGVSRPAYARTPTRARSTSISKRPRHQRSRSRKKGRPRRSSTVALLAATGTTPAAGPRPLPALSRQDSESSIRTVLAADLSNNGKDTELLPRSLAVEETLRDLKDPDRRRSLPFSDFALDGGMATTIGHRGASLTKPCLLNGGHKHSGEIPESDKLTERRIEIVRADEKRFRDLAFTALQDALETYSDEGNVQMCAMLALTAAEELGIPRSRTRRFLDSYIDLLQRSRIYACAAHLRKFCSIESIRNRTLVETVIYTACGRCRKPIAAPKGFGHQGNLVKGGHSYCTKCQSYVARCVVCRLPIRTLSMQCSICHHGAHQECYRDYHQQNAPASIRAAGVYPAASARNDRQKRGQQSGSAGTHADAETGFLIDPDLSRNDLKILGRLCAGGCGHHCWLSVVQAR